MWATWPKLSQRSSELGARRANVYVDLPDGQLHVHGYQPARAAARRAVVCLHPMPHSGAFFGPFAAALAVDRPVYCPDLPGYGASYRPDGQQSIEQFAAAVSQALAHLPEAERGYDLLGFHTGCFVAAEIAIAEDIPVGRLVLPGVPCFPSSERAAMKSRRAVPPAYLDQPAQLGALWETRRKPVEDGLHRDGLFHVMLEELRSAPDGYLGFNAAFDYAPELRLPKVSQSSLVIADARLFQQSLAAGVLLPNVRIMERPDWKAPLFFRQAEALANVARQFLDEDG